MVNVLDRAKQMLGLSDPKEAEADRMIAAFDQETKAVDYWSLKIKDCAAGRAILDAAPDMQVVVLIRLCEQTGAVTDYQIIHRLEKLVAALSARALPFTAPDLERLMAACRRHDWNGEYFFRLQLWNGVTRVTCRFLDAGEALTPSMRKILTEARAWMTLYRNKDAQKIIAAISEALGDTRAGLPDPGEAWADYAVAEVASSDAWKSVFVHAAMAAGAKPSAKWLKEAENNRHVVGEAEFRQRVTVWMHKAAPPPAFDKPAPVYGDTVVYEEFQQANKEYRAALNEYHKGISEKNITILKGLAWYASTNDDADLARALGHMAEAAFGNVRERGAWAKSAGNAAIWALGQMPSGVGVAPLARLRTRLRDRTALKLIASSIEAAAKNANMTMDELEDLAVPTGGLGADGTRREVFGEMDADAGSDEADALRGG